MGPFKYKITDTELQVMIGSSIVRKVALNDIERVDQKYIFWNEHWTNFWPMKFLTVRRKTGLIKNFVINPPDPLSFLAQLRSGMPK